MPSKKIHDFTSASTNPIYIDYTALNTQVNYATSKLTVSFKDVKMRLSEGIFNYHIKAFLAVEFFDAAGNHKSTVGNDSIYKVIYNYDTEVYEYTYNDLLENKIPNTSPSKGTDQRTSPWQYFKAPYLILEKLSETEGGGATAAWNAVTSARDKSFTINIPSGAASAKLYIMSDSDPYWQYPSNENWQLWCASCPCGSHATSLNDHISKLEEVNIVIEPIKHNSNTISASHNYNRFTVTVPPFVKGTNNPVKWQRVHINTRRDDLFTDEYYPLKKFITNIRSDWSVTARQKTNLKIVNASSTDVTKKYALENYGSSYSGYSAGEYLYEKVNDSYIKVPGGLTSLDIESGKYYLRITKDVSIKQITDLEDQKTWAVDKAATYEYPIPLTTIGPGGNVSTSDLNKKCIYGANWVWVDAVAKDSQESLFTGSFSGGTTDKPLCQDTGNKLYQGWFEGKPDANGNKTYYIVALIHKDNYNNANFFKNKSFSKDYFITSWHYAPKEAITYGGKTLYLFEEVPLGDSTGEYYLANRSYWGGDLRRTCNFDMSFYSFPRAPRRTGYLSTSTTNGKQKNSDDYTEEKPLRVRSKDILTFRWSDAFGDINKPEAPEGYRVYLKYKKDGEGTAKYLPLTLDEVSGINGQPKKIETERDLAYNEISNNIKAFGKITKINFAKDVNGQETNYLGSFDLEDDHISIIPKNFGLSSGDIVYCQIISYITPVKRELNTKGSLTETLQTRIYSNANEDDEVFNNFTGINLDQTAGTITVGGTTVKTDSEGLDALYSSTYDSFDPNKSFIDGGRPSIDDDYDIAEVSTELKGNGTVWVKISDTGKSDDWVEGTPWVKTDKGWKEADSLHVKTTNSATGWKESD